MDVIKLNRYFRAAGRDKWNLNPQWPFALIASIGGKENTAFRMFSNYTLIQA